MFSPKLIQYTEEHLRKSNVELKLKTRVKSVSATSLIIIDENNNETTIPFGLLVWATGNRPRPFISDLINDLGSSVKRGLQVDEYLSVVNANNMFSIGDASASSFHATAQVAARQGTYLAKFLNHTVSNTLHDAKKVVGPFKYQHMGHFAYIGTDKAIAELGNASLGGTLTFYLWKSAFLNNIFTWRNRGLVFMDWLKKFVIGRDISRE